MLNKDFLYLLPRMNEIQLSRTDFCSVEHKLLATVINRSNVVNKFKHSLVVLY